jgi:hypothetical protein
LGSEYKKSLARVSYKSFTEPFGSEKFLIARYKPKSITDGRCVFWFRFSLLSFWYCARNAGSSIQASPVILNSDIHLK